MREHIKNNIMSFFIIVTLVNIAIFVSGMILAPDEKLDYTAFIVPVIDGLLGVIPAAVERERNEAEGSERASRPEACLPILYGYFFPVWVRRFHQLILFLS